MNRAELKKAVESAVQSFLDKDIQLLQLNAYEPAVSHRIAFYLERDYFPKDIHVDCEYDKRFDLEKPGPDGKPMRPDIVVHTRNSRRNNMVALEIKKTRTSRRDIEKLKTLTKRHGLYEYTLGVFVRFPSGKASFRWFVDGVETQL